MNDPGRALRGLWKSFPHRLALALVLLLGLLAPAWGQGGGKAPLPGRQLKGFIRVAVQAQGSWQDENDPDSKHSQAISRSARHDVSFTNANAFPDNSAGAMTLRGRAHRLSAGVHDQLDDTSTAGRVELACPPTANHPLAPLCGEGAVYITIIPAENAYYFTFNSIPVECVTATKDGATGTQEVRVPGGLHVGPVPLPRQGEAMAGSRILQVSRDGSSGESLKKIRKRGVSQDDALDGVDEHLQPLKVHIEWNFEAPDDELLFDVGSDYDQWFPAPRPEDLAGVAPDAGEAVWKPLSVKVKIQEKAGGGAGRGGRIRFTLEQVSRNAGVCINFPQNGQAKADLRFAQKQAAGITVTGQDADVATTEEKMKVTEATVVIESRDPGAYGTLKAECKELKLIAEYKATGRKELKIPRDDDENHIADAWEKAQGIQGREATWDDASVPGQPTRGDGLALYEKYRGAVVLEGSAKTWKRLPTEEKVLFVVDESNFFPTGTWKASSGITAFRLGRDLTESTSNPEASRRVNFNASTTRNGKKTAVVLTAKATGDEEKIAVDGGKNDLGFTSTADRPEDITFCRVYPERIRGGIRFNMGRVQVAIDNYEAKTGVMSKTFSKEDLVRALARMKDPAVFQGLYAQTLKWTVLHEMGHACGIDGHREGGAEGSQGDAGCFMRYPTMEDDRLNQVRQALAASPAPVPPGINHFCKSGFNCLNHMDVHDR